MHAHGTCQVEAHAGSSIYWRMLGLVLRQFDGIVAGYQARHAADPSSLPQLTRRDLVFLNGNGALANPSPGCCMQPDLCRPAPVLAAA